MRMNEEERGGRCEDLERRERERKRDQKEA
jgi:hypothetical protein